MEERGGGSGLSWRSRGDTSWWTSAVDLSSTLISKMDQVPASFVGFTLPWHAGGTPEPMMPPQAQQQVQHQTPTQVQQQVQPQRQQQVQHQVQHQVQSQRQQQVHVQQVHAQAQRGGEFGGFWTEGYNMPVELPCPKNQVAQALQAETKQVEGAANGVDSNEVTEKKVGAKTGNCSSFSGPRVGESRRRTKRMPVELAPARSQEQDSGAPMRSKRLSSVSQECLLGQGARMERDSASIRLVDGASFRSSGRFSSRSLLLEDTIKNNPLHALPPPPPDGANYPEAFRGTSSNPTCDSHRLSKKPVLGGSYRVTGSSDAAEAGGRESASLPSSPKQPRASKLLRKLKISSRVRHESGEPGVVAGKVANPIASQHGQKFSKSLPTIRSECIARGSDSGSHRDAGNGAGLQGHGEGQVSAKKSTSRWLFKWKWGATKVPVRANLYAAKPDDQRRGLSPTAEIMSDARDAFYKSKSDRCADQGHRRGASWGCASLAATAAITPIRKGARIHNDESCSFRSAGGHSLRSTGDHSFRSAGGHSLRSTGDHSFRSTGGHSFRSTGGHSFRSAGGHSFRSTGALSFRKPSEDLVFEDCHGSFRSVASGGSSCASFRSVEEIEWDRRLPPPLPADQTLTIGDVAALCNSSLKFVFKCREIHHFNKFLRTQKNRLLKSTSDGERFNLILSGSDTEVSSMVAAMAYAWFLENTVPKVAGETWHAVPMIDLPRRYMHKHKSAAWLFDACGIDPAALLYSDEVELGGLIAAGRVKNSAVGQDVLVTRNEVGSVCTLLGEKLVAEAQCLLEPRYMKTLLLAGILLDTENLDFASMRDTEMTTTLLVGSGSLGRNGFFDQLKDVEDDERVSKFINRSYGQLSGRKTALKSKMQQEAESDKDSLFTQSQDHTSTSEAGTNSSLEEDSPRLKQQRPSFKFTPAHSAPAATSHQLPSPSRARCDEDGKAVAHIRKAATLCAKPMAPGSPNSTRIRKKLFLYQA